MSKNFLDLMDSPEIVLVEDAPPYRPKTYLQTVDGLCVAPGSAWRWGWEDSPSDVTVLGYPVVVQGQE